MADVKIELSEEEIRIACMRYVELQFSEFERTANTDDSVQLDIYPGFTDGQGDRTPATVTATVSVKQKTKRQSQSMLDR